MRGICRETGRMVVKCILAPGYCGMALSAPRLARSHSRGWGMTAKCAYDFSFRGIDGGDLPVAGFRGKVLMVVNVASRCGLTPQYAGLERLWTARRDDGLVV